MIIFKRKTAGVNLAAVLLFALPLTSGAEAYNGYTLFGPNNSRATYLIDMNGNTVHTWNHNRSGGYSAYLLSDGYLMRTANVDRPQLGGGGSQGVVQKVNWNGANVWEYTYSSATYLSHHDIEPMPNGNVLLIAWEVKTAAQAQAAGLNRNASLWPDHIIEVRQTGANSGEIVWQWHAWDHLVQDYNQNRANYGVVAQHPELLDINVPGGGGGMGGGDWMHINGKSYNPETDQIVISSHELDEIYVIDHSTTTAEAASHQGGRSGKGGDFLYRWGKPSNYDMQGAQVFDVVHCSIFILNGLPGAGHILAFNNRENQRTSMVVEIDPPRNDEGYYIRDLNAAYGPAQPCWSYTANDFFSNHLGSCQRLPNGNTLMVESTTGHLLEVNIDGAIQWQYTYRGEVVRSLRYAADYPGLYALHPVNAGVLLINELLALNCTNEPDQDGEFDGWIELYNTSNSEQSLWGFHLTDDANNAGKWTFPDTSISARGRIIVWMDGQSNQTGLHANFTLQVQGGRIILTSPNLTTLDNVEYGEQTADVSYGRYPDGADHFEAMPPTFGEANREQEEEPEEPKYPIALNELLVLNQTTAADQNGEFNSWIELYNYADSTVSMNGCFLTDDANDTTKWPFPDINLNPREYLIVWLDGDVNQDGLHSSIVPTAMGGQLTLTTAMHSVIDTLFYGFQTADISFGRYPDGSGDFIPMTPTLGEPNAKGIISGVGQDRLTPNHLKISAAFPNPFNSATTLRISLPTSGAVSLMVYDAKGRRITRIAEGVYPEGSSDVVWSGADDAGRPVETGLYFCIITCGKQTAVQKLILIR